jgi:transposase
MMHLGIDLSKSYFDAMLRLPSGEKVHEQFENNAAGFKELARWLKGHKAQTVHACMEATNIYWEALAAFLHAAGHRVSVVNPARIKGFAMSQLRRNKTDKQDSDVICEFCYTSNPDGWTPPTPAQQKLRVLVRHRDSLVKTLTQQKNRLADCQDEDVRASLQRVIATLQAELDRLEEEIAQFIAQDETLRAQKALLLSIKGFGPVVTHKLMAEMYDLAEYEDAHAAAADAGVTPAHYESGDTVRRQAHMSKVGKASLRGALYFPAMTAMRFNPLVRPLVERLERLHKPWKVILGAVMRKLMHIAYGVLKHQTPFDPNFGRPPAPAS